MFPVPGTRAQFLSFLYIQRFHKHHLVPLSTLNLFSLKHFLTMLKSYFSFWHRSYINRKPCSRSLILLHYILDRKIIKKCWFCARDRFHGSVLFRLTAEDNRFLQVFIHDFLKYRLDVL